MVFVNVGEDNRVGFEHVAHGHGQVNQRVALVAVGCTGKSCVCTFGSEHGVDEKGRTRVIERHGGVSNQLKIDFGGGFRLGDFGGGMCALVFVRLGCADEADAQNNRASELACEVWFKHGCLSWLKKLGIYILNLTPSKALISEGI